MYAFKSWKEIVGVIIVVGVLGWGMSAGPSQVSELAYFAFGAIIGLFLPRLVMKRARKKK